MIQEYAHERGLSWGAAIAEILEDWHAKSVPSDPTRGQP
jgi:hypothetical protein